MIGAGAVGRAAADLARARGAEVHLAVRRGEQADALQALGYSAGSYPDDTPMPNGFEVVYETTGHRLPAAIRAVATFGRIVVIAAPKGGQAEVPILDLYRRGGSIVGVNSLLYDSRACARMLEGIGSLFAAGRLTCGPVREVPSPRRSRPIAPWPRRAARSWSCGCPAPDRPEACAPDAGVGQCVMQSPVVTYAIGDIHGCADLLDRLLALIANHADGRERKLVFLGDYIDRGPDSAAVLRTLSRLQWTEPTHVTCLMGNHERMLLDGLCTPEDAEHWLHNGGEATLAAFGAREPMDLPRDILDWVEALPTLHAMPGAGTSMPGCDPAGRPTRRTPTTGSGFAVRFSRAITISRGTWCTGIRRSDPASGAPSVPHQPRHRRRLRRCADGRGLHGRRGPAAAFSASASRLRPPQGAAPESGSGQERAATVYQRRLTLVGPSGARRHQNGHGGREPAGHKREASGGSGHREQRHPCQYPQGKVAAEETEAGDEE